MLFLLQLSRHVASYSTETDSIDSRFSEDEQRMILRKLNTASDDELSHYSRLTKQKATDLVTHRTNHGSFARLSDLTHVKGFGPALSNSICKNIVENKMSKIGGRARYVIDRLKVHPRYVANQVSEYRRERLRNSHHFR